MDITQLTGKVSGFFDPKSLSTRQIESPMEGLGLLRYSAPSNFEATLYEPVICLILQGRKTTTIGNRIFDFGPGESLIVSHDLPVVSRVTQASKERPYLALILQLDLGMLRSLSIEMDEPGAEAMDASSLQVSQTDPALLDALMRYLDIAESQGARQILAPLCLREIHYRLLIAPHGGMLRRLMHRDSHASHITNAIAAIRQNFRKPIVVADLARSAGMGVSSFHKHFKEITRTSPLQYLKELRLLEARRLMTTEGHAVSEAAFAVGYESPSQFSREYTRKFGVTPNRDRLEIVV